MPSKKSQRKQKKSKNLRRTYKKGGCGSCRSSEPSPFLMGGSSGSLDQAINQNPAVIPYNQSYGSAMDPNDPSNMVSVRMQPNMITGGSRSLPQKRVSSSRKRSTPIKHVRTSNKISTHIPFKGGKKNKKSRKLKGGNADPSAANAISSFGNTTGLSSAFNILTGNPSVNPSVTSQPIGNAPFGPHNPALV